MRCLLVHNPAAGGNTINRSNTLAQAAKALESRGHIVEIYVAQNPGDATTRAAQAVHDNFDAVFACGGDGTIHEVAQALISESTPPHTALGVLPMGSQNAFARNRGIPLNPVAAALAQSSGQSQPISVGKATVGNQSRHFILMAGAGPGGALIREMSRSDKQRIGRSAYALTALRLFLSRRFPAFTLNWQSANGHQQQSTAVEAIVSNASNLGGIFSRLLAPRNSSQDSWQLTIIRPPAIFSLPAWFAFSWLGLNNLNPFLQAHQFTHCEFNPIDAKPIHTQLDAEAAGDIPMEITIVPQALRVLTLQR